jgi:putative membrane protein
MASAEIDRNRAAVERTDAVVRELQDQVITDPTVFVKGAALGALTLIELAKRGVAKAQDPALRAFAAQVRDRQTAIRAELSAIAARQRLDVPGALIFPDEQMLQESAGKSGAEFDLWFVDHLVAEHFRSADLYTAAQRMTDASLAAFASRTLPKLNADRAAAQALRR